MLLMGLAVLCSCSSKPTVPEPKEIKLNYFGRFTRTFNDLNDKHLTAAQNIGIGPIGSREEAENLGRRKLREIESCKWYTIDTLTHSIPFLVPEAEELLENIGKSFIDTLENRGVTGYKIVVTSVLRAESDVKKLRKRNGNASSNSAHRYATTFDIAYNRFERTDEKYEVPIEQIKHVLAEVLLNLRKEDKCYIKYEVKQGCFHVTAR